MKKLILLIMMTVLTVTTATNVSALNNKLYFTEKDDRLYYDSDSFDKSIFMQHHDMIPGRKYTDELTIENKTSITYSLYLKVNNVDQDMLADELIDNTIMDVYLDDVLIYSGYARGLDYNDSGANLQDAILIGKFKKNANSKLVVETRLAEDYTNINNDSIGRIEWEFYASYDKKVTEVTPNTGDDIYKHIVLLVVSSITFALLIFKLEKKKTNEV